MSMSYRTAAGSGWGPEAVDRETGNGMVLFQSKGSLFGLIVSLPSRSGNIEKLFRENTETTLAGFLFALIRTI